jgi:hypothetical protein
VPRTTSAGSRLPWPDNCDIAIIGGGISAVPGNRHSMPQPLLRSDVEAAPKSTASRFQIPDPGFPIFADTCRGLFWPIRIVEPTGHESIVVLELNGHRLVSRVGNEVKLRVGDQVQVQHRPSKLHFFATENGARINDLDFPNRLVQT